MTSFAQTHAFKLIYVFTCPYDTHNGLIKVGEATLHTKSKPNNLPPNCRELNQAAHKRIKEYTGTASIQYNLLYTELAVKEDQGYFFAFSDKDVQRVLVNSLVCKVKPNGQTGEEWFKTSVDVAKNAITAVKKGQTSLDSGHNQSTTTPIAAVELREEQKEAVEKTLNAFKKGNEMLWYAKMRFGKTLTALEVVRRLQYRKVIILTHRPVVSDGWGTDFKKIFYPGSSENNYSFECKTEDSRYEFDQKIDFENDQKIKKLDNDKKFFIYFASIQDLRGSKLVGGKYQKNNAIFRLDWDLIIIDEAHEGTQTELGGNVVKLLRKEKTKILALSGTPFNLLQQYEKEFVYTWDYVMEQRKKKEWDLLHRGDHNPYADLPQMHIYTYDLSKKLKKFITDGYESKAFNFREFFRVWTNEGNNELPVGMENGKFVHEKDVVSFLNLLVNDEGGENVYPFVTPEYRDMFQHTLWMVPGVKEAKALSELLRQHPVFKNFGIANVAGEGDRFEDLYSSNALQLVRDTIKNYKYSITLSCGKLTTGVTVQEWTAVLMLSGSYSTAAAQYMQTIFRVQSAGTIDGKQKTDCYVFDFAPDRTLKVLTETAYISQKTGKNQSKSRKIIAEFINYCPVIAVEGSKMKPYSVNSMMEQVKQIYAERAVNSGFDDDSIYNDELLRLDNLDAKMFNHLKDIIGTSQRDKKKGEVDVNVTGLTEEEIAAIEDDGPEGSKQSLSPEEIARLAEIKKAKEARKKAIDILRGISIRMPLLIYGAEVTIDEDIDIEKFVNLVDEKSWEEFMPHGVTKELFSNFIKYYDRDIFIAAGKRIRRLAASADNEPPTKRVIKIAEIFSHFKNPDKETILTPWRVVNIHLSSTIGGWCFFNEKFEENTQERKRLDEPRFINQEEITETVFCNQAKILEINSKTGLYPLYLAYSFYRQRLAEKLEKDCCLEDLYKIWDEGLKNNIYIICKTPMAKSITKRTLCGYKNINFNAHHFEDLINQLKHKPGHFTKRVLNGSYWKKEVKEMKFEAVVGNPPYQEQIENRNEQPPVYHLFYDIAFNLANKVTLITPARYLFNAGKTPKKWNEKMLNDKHFSIVQYWNNSKEVFSNVDIKGGVAIGYRDKESLLGPIGFFTANDNIASILEKVKLKSTSYLNEIWTSNTAYTYDSVFFEEHPDLLDKVSGGSRRYLSSSVFDKFGKVFFDEKPNDGQKYIKILGRQLNKRTYKYFKLAYLNPPKNYAKYKVFLASSSGSGQIGEAFSDPIIGEPYCGATETFFSLGCFDKEFEAKNLLKYLKTRFSRVMLSVNKVTQAMKGEKVWMNVPLFDFNCYDFIDWNKSLDEIDAMLFSYFGLSIDEQNYIMEVAVSMNKVKRGQ